MLSVAARDELTGDGSVFWMVRTAAARDRDGARVGWPKTPLVIQEICCMQSSMLVNRYLKGKQCALVDFIAFKD
jgi:hypothetical protein